MARSYIGSCLAISATLPATEDLAGYQAIPDADWLDIGEITTISAFSDNSEEITFNLLKKGRTSRVNGVRDLGNISVTAILEDAANPGLALAIAQSNDNVTHAFRIDDDGGRETYFQGLPANWGDPERTSSQVQSAMGMIRTQTGRVSTP